MIRRNWEIYTLQFATLSIAFATAIVVISFCIHEFSIGNEYPENTVRILKRYETKEYEGRNRLHYTGEVITLKTDLETAQAELNSHNTDKSFTYSLQPLREVYFGPRVVGENEKHGEVYSVLILTCISGLILVLAITNFVNLVSLTLPARSKEIAIRKVAGANRSPLLGLLAKENGFVVLISFVIGVGILIATQTSPDISVEAVLIIVLLLILITLSPLIPACAFVKATPGRLLGTDAITFPRMKKVITVVQLGVSISLIISSLVIGRQISRSLIKEPGKNHEQVIYTKWPSGMSREYFNRLKNDWPRDNASIVELTAASHTPDNIQSKPIGEDYYQVAVDYDFKDFFRLEMSKGRWFGAMDFDSVVVNEAAAGTISKPLGVIKDFSPDKPVHFSIIELGETNFILIRVIEVDIRKTLKTIERSFSEISGRPTTISFLDKNYEETLAYEDNLNKLSDVLSITGLIMAACAIYALSLSRMNDNMKQIAIRKTFGASNTDIIQRLAWQFFELMLGSLFFFGPVTYLLLTEWLRNFAYAAKFTWADPFISIGICFAIVVVTNLSLLIKLRKPLTAIHRGLQRT